MNDRSHPGAHDLGTYTQLTHLGEEQSIMGAVVQPIFQNSLFTFETAAELLHALEAAPVGPPHHYSRISNPTVDLAEKKIAFLEGTEACKLTGCGMGAITSAVLHFLKSGCHVVISDTAYPPVRSLLSGFMARFQVSVTMVSGTCVGEIEAAIRPETTLIYLETPTSGLFRLMDIPAITKIARERGIATVIDNTYNTPLHFNPAAHGVDVVCHSATKYMGGHSDITAGAICGTREVINAITMAEVNLLGNALHPFSAWLLTRGLRTLPLRLKRHEATANEVAAWLETQPNVERVHHVSLPSFPQRDLYLQQFRGSGGLFSFEPKHQSREKVLEFCDALQLFGRGISWGGHESLVVPLLCQPADYAEPTWVIRLFTGLEDPVDLIRDISAALAVFD